MVVWGAFLVKKLLSNNSKERLRKCNNKKKCQKQGQWWTSCLKKPTFCPKGQLVKFAQKLRNITTF